MPQINTDQVISVEICGFTKSKLIHSGIWLVGQFNFLNHKDIKALSSTQPVR
jgi:hypothetical protein